MDRSIEPGAGRRPTRGARRLVGATVIALFVAVGVGASVHAEDLDPSDDVVVIAPDPEPDVEADAQPEGESDQGATDGSAETSVDGGTNDESVADGPSGDDTVEEPRVAQSAPAVPESLLRELGVEVEVASAAGAGSVQPVQQLPATGVSATGILAAVALVLLVAGGVLVRAAHRPS